LLFTDLLNEQTGAWPQIYIPWRDAYWPIDRVLHAAWIYHNILVFRDKALQRKLEGGGLVKSVLLKSQSSARVAYGHLLKELRVLEKAFALAGAEILDRINQYESVS
jgi:hypothetical protein